MGVTRDHNGNIRVSIDVDARQYEDISAMLSELPNGLRRVTILAINDTLRSGRQVIVKGLSELTTLKQKDIRDRLRIIKATNGRASGLIGMRNVKFALWRFKHREDRRKKGWGTKESGSGVTVQIMRSGGGEVHPHAFLATTKVRGRNIFQRAKTGPGSGRRNIHTLVAENVSQIFWNSPELGQRLVDRLREQFAKNLLSKTQYLLSKKR